MTEKQTKDFWIFEPYLAPTLLLLSHVLGFKFDSYDLTNIKYALTATSKAKNIWDTFEFISDKKFDLFFCRDEEDTGIIFIRLTVDKTISEQIDLCIFVVENFYIQHRHYHTDMKIYE